MKNNLIKFNRISKLIDMNQFFSISITEYSISVLGWSNEELLNNLMKQQKFERTIDDNSFTFTRKGLIITLAIKP